MRGKYQINGAADQLKNSIQESLRRIRICNRSFNRQIGNFGKRPDSAYSEEVVGSFDFKPTEDKLLNKTFKKFIMNKFNRARKLFGSIDFSSDSSKESVISISSEDEASDGWNSDWSTDTEEMIKRVETQVKARPIPITGRRMTTASDEPGTSAMPSELQITPKLDRAYFDENLC